MTTAEPLHYVLSAALVAAALAAVVYGLTDPGVEAWVLRRVARRPHRPPRPVAFAAALVLLPLAAVLPGDPHPRLAAVAAFAASAALGVAYLRAANRPESPAPLTPPAPFPPSRATP